MDEWPLVGRGSELALVADSLARPECAGLLLVGSAGVGKTRLANECVDLATRAGFATVYAKATLAAASIPFGALTPLLGDLLPDIDRHEPTARGLAHAADAIASLGGTAPLLVFADDAHNLDGPSAALLHQLTLTRRAFVLATFRSGEEIQDALAGLWKDGASERIDIGPLARPDVEHLVSLVLDGPVDAPTLQRLWRSSRGNVLYLRELLTWALETGSLRRSRDVWRMTGEPTSSPRLVELIGDRLAGLSEPARRCLEVVALAEPIGSGLVATVADVAAVAELERKHLVEFTIDGRRQNLRLAHPLYGDVIRAQVPAWETAALSAQLADGVERAGARRREDALRVGSWRLAGGGAGVDPALLVRAARQAQHAEDLPLAERLARAALLAGGGVDASEVLGSVVDAVGRHAEAEEIMAAADLSTATEKQRALLVMFRARNLFWGLGRFDEAIAITSEAEASFDDPVWRCRLSAHRARFHLLAGRPAQALVLAERILAGDETRVWGDAAIVAIPALTMAGRSEEAVAAADQLEAETRRRGVRLWNPGALAVPKALALIEGGHLTGADQLADAGYRASLEAGSRDGQAWFAVVLARAALLRGDLPSAIRWFTESSLVWSDHEEVIPLRWCLSGLALAHAARNDVEETAKAGVALAAASEGPLGNMGPDVLRAESWVLLVQGQAADCQARMWDAIELAKEINELPLEAAALHDLARLGFASEVAGRLSDVASRCDGLLVPLEAAHARAIASDDPVALTEAASGFESMGAFLFAAEAATQAAAAWRRKGQPRRATLLERTAQAHLGRCPGAATPALIAAGVQATLTAREREIALLAAQGQRSKQIGAAVGLSARTVDNYLQRVFDKLGVHRREDLPAALAVSETDQPTNSR